MYLNAPRDRLDISEEFVKIVLKDVPSARMMLAARFVVKDTKPIPLVSVPHAKTTVKNVPTTSASSVSPVSLSVLMANVSPNVRSEVSSINSHQDVKDVLRVAANVMQEISVRIVKLVTGMTLICVFHALNIVWTVDLIASVVCAKLASLLMTLEIVSQTAWKATMLTSSPNTVNLAQK